jgi:hypothetical protein
MNAQLHQLPLDLALEYLQRNWKPVPVGYKTKKPIGGAWQLQDITAENVSQYFNGAPQNVGVQMGSVSNGLLDNDLDCDEAVSLAPWIMPHTKAIFGRKSRAASHRLYRSNLCETTLGGTVQFLDPTRGKGVMFELRIGAADEHGELKGAQTVFPGSVHEDGELIRWDEAGEPAEVDGEQLLRDAGVLASARQVVAGAPRTTPIRRIDL